MSKEMHDIPITLVLPRHEVMFIIRALQQRTDSEHQRGLPRDSAATTVLADKIFNIAREQFVAFENQNEK